MSADQGPVRGEQPDLAAVMADLLDQVAGRRAAGEYPEGLEEALDAQWRRVTGTTTGDGAVAATLHDVHRHGRFHVPAVEVSSRLPGGAAVHRAVGATVSRHLQDLVGQLDAFASSVHAALTALAERLADPGAHTHADIEARLDEVSAHLADLHRATNQLRP